MIDDSLSDVQQEKKMSVKELKFDEDEITLKVKVDGGLILLQMANPESETDMYLDRSQAHLLMLYLQEHLK